MEMGETEKYKLLSVENKEFTVMFHIHNFLGMKFNYLQHRQSRSLDPKKQIYAS